MALMDVFKEATQQEILRELRAQSGLISVIAKGYDISSWEALFEISRSGGADKILSVGDQLIGTYKIDDTHEYSCPWDVIDFRDVTAKVNGVEVEYKNVPLIQMHYTGHENQPYDPAELTEATETTAQSDVFYCGFDGTNYTMLSLAAGSTIPYGDYTKVYKTPYNSVNAIRYGNSDWALSWLRQYLNNSGTGWAQKTHDYDVLPNDAENIKGFLTYLDAGLVDNLHPVKVLTKQSNWAGNQLLETWDKLFPLAVAEMNMSHGAVSTEEGEPTAFYKALLESETKKPTGTYPALIKYAVNANTSAQTVRLRSSSLGYAYVWFVSRSGYVTYDNPMNGYRVAPACYPV